MAEGDVAPSPRIASPAQAAAGGARVLLVGQLLKGTSQLIGVVLLSRILEPAVFGVAAIAAVIVGLGELIRDAGLTTAALREPDLDRLARSGLFWWNLILGSSTGLLLVVSAPLIVVVFNVQLASPAIQALGVVFVVNGWAAQYRADLLRTMRFRPVAVADGLGALVGLAVAVSIAVLRPSYWALIWQFIAAAVVTSMIVWAKDQWRPGSARTLRYAMPFLGFGAGVTLSQGLAYLGNNVDVMFLGARSSINSLGVYNRAFQIVMAPASMIQIPIQNSVVPALSRLRADRPAMVRLIARAQLAVGICAVFVPALVAASAPGLLPIALGPGWEGTIPIAWWLASAAALQLLASIASWIFVAEGLGSRLAAYSFVSLLVRASIIFPLASRGPEAVAIGYFIGTLLLWPVAITWACRSAKIPVLATLARSAAMFLLYIAAAGTGNIVASRASGTVLALVYGSLVAAVVYSTTLASSRVRSVVASVVRRSP